MVKTVEEIILQHSGRGMDILSEYVSKTFCKEAVCEILSWDKGVVFLTTGFYVGGYAETDGPAGTFVLARALKALGYFPIILTDSLCKDYFEPEGLEVIYVDQNFDEIEAKKLLNLYKPVGLISIERCGRNTQHDYANMRGISIKEHTAPIDVLFQLAYNRIPTVGIGDGGNEIGMGNLAFHIVDKLEKIPCTVCVDKLVIATVSNWGAYGMTAYLSKITNQKLLPPFDEIKNHISRTIELGCVDGVTKEHTLSVDGFPIEIEERIVKELETA